MHTHTHTHRAIKFETEDGAEVSYRNLEFCSMYYSNQSEIGFKCILPAELCKGTLKSLWKTRIKW